MRRFVDSLRGDVTGGFLLITAAVLALIWANSPWADGYAGLRDWTFGPAALHLDLSLEAWASDGVLAVFFFIVGNELKQEFTDGELRNPRRAALPIVAAVCGALVPAGIFALVTLGDPGAARGWGIPMATDIAFAVAILAVIGRGLPPALRTFLLTLAIVDDLVAIVVIAVFYAAGFALLPLLGAAVLLGVFWVLQQRLRRGWIVFVPLAVAIWGLMHASGVHATIAGAAMGLLMRTDRRSGEAEDPSHRTEHVLRPYTMGLVLPIFAFLAAGVTFGPLGGRAAIGILLGLIVGKVIGIAGGGWLATKVTSAELSPSLGWLDIIGMAQLAGIGFTVSLLIAELSYPAGDQRDEAKGAVLIASAVATLLAAIILRIRIRAHRAAAADPR